MPMRGHSTGANAPPLGQSARATAFTLGELTGILFFLQSFAGTLMRRFRTHNLKLASQSQLPKDQLHGGDCSQTVVRVVDLSRQFLRFRAKLCPTLFCSLSDLRSRSSRENALRTLGHFLVGRTAHGLGCCLDAAQFVLNGCDLLFEF